MTRHAPSGPVFTGDLAAPEPPPAESVAAALRLMESGRLFRYGETAAGPPEAALLEEEFAALQGAAYAVACNSGGGALFLALKALGVGPGDRVLLNAFTLAPVPGAIAHAGAEPVIVDIGDRFVIDPADLEAKARASGAKVLLLSHMRGHIADMDAVMAVADRLGLAVVEDCAHATGAFWAGRRAGSFGRIGCFSAQSYKHFNAGEGGLLTTDDADLAARAIVMSGSYMLYAQHRARPDEAVFERWRGLCPNFSLRMSGLAAALIRPQLPLLAARVEQWRAIHDRIAAALRAPLMAPVRPAAERAAPTSIQFTVEGRDEAGIAAFIAATGARGVPVKWFGAARAEGFTSRPDHWTWLPAPADAPNARRVLARLCDVRLPLGLTEDEAETVAAVLNAAAAETAP